jgi:hypothetical protein
VGGSTKGMTGEDGGGGWAEDSGGGVEGTGGGCEEEGKSGRGPWGETQRISLMVIPFHATGPGRRQRGKATLARRGHGMKWGRSVG